MNTLANGESVELKLAPNACTLSRRGEVYACTCSEWGSMPLPENQRTCSHLVEYLGLDVEKKRVQKAAIAHALSEEMPDSKTLINRYKTIISQTNSLRAQEKLPPEFAQSEEKAEKALKKNSVTEKDTTLSAIKKANALMVTAGSLNAFPELAQRCLEQSLQIYESELLNSMPHRLVCGARASLLVKQARLKILIDDLSSGKQKFEAAIAEYSKALKDGSDQVREKKYSRLVKTFESFLQEHFPTEAATINKKAGAYDMEALPLEFWEDL